MAIINAKTTICAAKIDAPLKTREALIVRIDSLHDRRPSISPDVASTAHCVYKITPSTRIQANGHNQTVDRANAHFVNSIRSSPATTGSATNNIFSLLCFSRRLVL